jgi:hypothetical protein
MLDTNQKLAKQWLPALELTKSYGNVSEACRRRGLSCTQFYEYKQCFQTDPWCGLAQGFSVTCL